MSASSPLGRTSLEAFYHTPWGLRKTYHDEKSMLVMELGIDLEWHISTRFDNLLDTNKQCLYQDGEDVGEWDGTGVGREFEGERCVWDFEFGGVGGSGLESEFGVSSVLGRWG